MLVDRTSPDRDPIGADGTDLVSVCTVDADGLITSMRAYGEPERAMAAARTS